MQGGRARDSDLAKPVGENAMSDDDVIRLIQQLEDGEDSTTFKFWESYFPRLVRYARTKLRALPRRASDEEDIAASALKSFFRGASEGRFELKDQGDLWNLLVKITVRKVTAEKRRFFAQKRGGGKTRGGSVFEPRPDDSRFKEVQVHDNNPMPEFVDDVVKACEDLLRLLPNVRHRETALLKMEGHTNREIAEVIGCSVARIKQLLSEIRSIWKNVDGVTDSMGRWRWQG